MVLLCWKTKWKFLTNEHRTGLQPVKLISDRYPKKKRSVFQGYVHSPMSVTGFGVAKAQTQARCLLTKEQVTKVWYGIFIIFCIFMNYFFSIYKYTNHESCIYAKMNEPTEHYAKLNKPHKGGQTLCGNQTCQTHRTIE